MKTIGEIKKLYNETSFEDLLNFCEEYKEDTRKGVEKLVESAKRKYDDYLTELKRCDDILVLENELYDKGAEYILGIDEVGRGPLAGPVVTCAVILPKGVKIMYANDSKKLSKKMREKLYDEIIEKALSVQISVESVETIDSINILEATKLAMKKAVENSRIEPSHVLVDALTLDIKYPQSKIIKGDEKSMSIACASIVAKVYRDQMMTEFSEIYSEYAFEKNKGYGSSEHIDAIKKYGLTPIHRRTFVKNIVGNK